MSELVITRIFDAPRPMVYRAFTDPDQLAAWFGPVGWSVPRDTVDVDARVGGKQVFTMVNDADPSMASPVNAVFTAVVENELLVGEEDVSHIPDFGAAKLVMRLEFHDEEGGRTRLVLTQSPFPAEMETGAREGWGSSFTKLDKLLA
ncbi:MULTISPECIES: SRPBCC family protein [Actinoplanes]|uniref:Activator of Hsp90 ATPase homologue 1/2-like C-terminal domain-containing protein n=2 Tax=Actinoplanes TaxID=1865 RepID=A0A0X3V4I2_9ACTN|nr:MULTISPECIES: SRPBCC domain-containing protein [Actinoplanes]KUL39578.1 hypothetical protein ADL15_09100 [Actinoplanes awajinensis subsp. mycoplanecinus]GIE72917.1 activator of HSP90 ATPase [Actinoplanes palleronii]